MAAPHQTLLTKTETKSHNQLQDFILTSFVAVFLVVFFVAPSKFEVKHSNPGNAAQDSQLCLSHVSGLMSSDSDGLTVLQKYLVQYVHQMNNAIRVVHKFKNQANDIHQEGALTDCLELLDLSIDLVSDCIAALDKRSRLGHANAQSWLSGVLTNHVTCLDELDLSSTKTEAVLDELVLRAKVALAMLASVTTQHEDVLRSSWVSSRDRKLMERSGKDIKADVVVGKDESGDYQTLGEAVGAAPEKKQTWYVCTLCLCGEPIAPFDISDDRAGTTFRIVEATLHLGC